MRIRLSASLLALLLGLPAAAAPALVRNPRPLFAEVSLEGVSVAGNFAGDAALDLAVVNSMQNIKLLTSVVDGPFAAPVSTPIDHGTLGAACGHFDADGFLDLAVSVTWTGVKLYLGNGDGTFRAGVTVPTAHQPIGIAVADVNGDGDADVIAASPASGLTVHLGDGAGGLGTAITTATLPARSVVTADLNADGKPDVVAGDDTNVRVGLGIGNGQFTAGFHSTGSGGSAVGDFDNDGKVDLFVPFGNLGQYRLHRGAGDGTFLAPSLHVLLVDTTSQRMRAADVDADGNLDVIAAAQSGPIVVLRGNGDGTFDEREAWLTDTVQSFHAADFDRDGVLDLLYESWYPQGRRFLVRGTGGGAFDAHPATDAARATQPRVLVHGMAPADVNGDTHPDLVVMTAETVSGKAADLAVYLNDGDGHWSAPLFTSLDPQEYATWLHVADLNVDGKPDVIAGGDVLLGNGDGTFQNVPTTYHPRFVADFTGDGKPDIVVDSGFESVIHAGTGSGFFSLLRTLPFLVTAIADFNGDGHMDVAGQPESGGYVMVGLNDGSGNFTVDFSAAPVYSVLTAADFNGDTHPDLLANFGGTRVLPGRGDGTFGDPIGFRTNAGLYSVTRTFDVDGDGALDLLNGGEILLGSGNGRFRSYAAVRGAWSRSTAADFDGDGALELVVDNGSFIARVRTFEGPDPVVPVPMTLAAPPVTPRYAEPLTFTATLGTPAVQSNGGAVVFTQDGQPVALAVVGDDVSIGFYTRFFSLGTHTVAAAFTGDAHHAPAAQELTFAVERAITGIWVQPSSKPCAAEVLVWADLFPQGTLEYPGPEGEITFRKGNTLLPSSHGPGRFNYFVSGLGVGTHEITAEYAGDANHLPFSTTFTQVVTAPWSASLSASSAVFANESNHYASVTGDVPAGLTYTWSVTNGSIVSGQGTSRIRYAAGASGEVTLQVTVAQPGSACAVPLSANVPIVQRQAAATMFYSITPCRLVDTRGGTPLAHAADAITLIAGSCGIPAGAKSVVANVTVIGPAASGWLSLFPSDGPWPGTSTVSYRTGKTRGTQSVVALSADGRLTVRNSGAAVHYLIDVYGWFQ